MSSATVLFVLREIMDRSDARPSPNPQLGPPGDLRDSTTRPVSLVDAGCGYGDLLRDVRAWPRRYGVAIALHGVDVSRQTIRIANAAMDERNRITFEVADILDYRPAFPVDLVVSLVAHHLSDERIIDLLRWTDATASRGWLLCDLQRHPIPYFVIGAMGRLSSLAPTVFRDWQISVARALSRHEWQPRLGAAGIPRDCMTFRWFLFRHLIGRLR